MLVGSMMFTVHNIIIRLITVTVVVLLLIRMRNAFTAITHRASCC